jgi:hypothetical protein
MSPIADPLALQYTVAYDTRVKGFKSRIAGHVRREPRLAPSHLSSPEGHGVRPHEHLA